VEAFFGAEVNLLRSLAPGLARAPYMCSSERPYEWPVCVQGGGASVKTALLFKTISLRRCKPLSLNRIMGLIERMQEYKSTLSDFIRDYSIPDEKWNDLIDLLGLYSEKLGKGEDIAGRDIEEALREIYKKMKPAPQGSLRRVVYELQDLELIYRYAGKWQAI